MRNSFFFTILYDFVSLFYPRYCLGCSNSLVKGEEVVCTRCMLEMPQTGYHTDPENPLKLRLAGRLELGYALAFFRFSKTGSIQQLLHQLKYKNHPEIGVMLGKVYGFKLKALGLQSSFDLIIPVPLHPGRLRRRGYNQSSMFAQGLSLSLGIPFSDHVLTRKVSTETQTRKTKLKRWENVQEVFTISKADQIVNKRILLVDDVITTGATVEACGNVLQRNGCSTLSIACIAVA